MFFCQGSKSGQDFAALTRNQSIGPMLRDIEYLNREEERFILQLGAMKEKFVTLEAIRRWSIAANLMIYLALLDKYFS